MNKYFILSHLGLGDNIFTIPLVNYLSENNYVELVCKKHNEQNIKYFFKNNKNVSLFLVNDDGEISPNFGCSNEKFNNITKDKIILLSGLHTKNSMLNTFPFFIYNDTNYDLKIFKNYFNVQDTDKSILLFNLIKDLNYIFICNDSSIGEIFNISDFLNKHNINPDETIIICSNKNFYNKDHKFFNLANNFVYNKNDLLILDYKKVLENANMIAITDSSLFTFTVQLNIVSKNNFLFVRCTYVDWDNLLAFFEKKFTIIN